MSDDEERGWKRAQEEKGRWREELERGESNNMEKISFTSVKK